MTSTVMMTPKQAHQEWGKVFPQDFTTMEGSCLFIKKLIAVSLSSITYLRGVFPEQAYGERSLCGIKLKILTEDSGIPAVSKFINTIRSCYDAVDKKYICPNSQKRDEVIEAYNLVFRYKEDEYSITCNNNRKIFSPNLSDPTVKATLTMLQNLCQLDELLTPLPPHASLNMKLLYYDDITPPDYEPEGFEPSSTTKFQFPEKAVNILLGQIATDFHSYKFVLKTTNAINYSLTQPTSEDPVMIGSQDRAETARDTTEDHQSSKEIISDSWKSDKDGKIQKSQKSKRCPCTCTERHDDDFIACIVCQSKQHKICYGILKNEDIPENFYCNDCFYNHSDGMPETNLVYSFKGNELEEFCAMRRALVICSQLKTLTTANLAKLLGCTTALTNALINRLEKEKFLTKRTTKKSGYNVEKEYILNVGIPEYFPLRKKQGCANPQNRLSRKKARKDENAKRSHEEEDDDDMCISNDKKRNKSIVEEVEVLSIHSSPEILQSQNSQKRSSSQVFSSQEVFQSTNKKKRGYF
ncbi:HORMA domain-containing protein 2-like isoform X2 [Stegodyphus dumicola]|uniref:HORMA domain-containing protein 2-like isoform X2 n=1 Tax=Stegodyphus dumicola TaxID=202533 RepID=UPI0015A87BB5|nr:HORMA domain-containing protein 2-like isoform X2 [Stegodyphus dumicola]